MVCEDAAPSEDGRYILELPLKVDIHTEHILIKRFEAARQVYNAVLGESKRRLRLMRECKLYQKARKLPKGKQRTAAFRAAAEAFGFRKYDLQFWSKYLRKGWIGHHLDSRTTKAITNRAFKAVELSAYERRKVKFKRYGELRSVEPLTNADPLKWRDGCVIWNVQAGHKLNLKPVLRDDPVIAHGLHEVDDRIRYVRLCWRTIRGKHRFFAQLILKGAPLQRYEERDGVVGLDIGPSTIAIVGEDEAVLVRFCTELDEKCAKARRLQRRLDKRRRAANPHRYNEDGTVKRGVRERWVQTEGYKRTRAQLADLNRRIAAQRKTLHGQLVNKVLSMGTTIKTEKLSYKSFQRNWGKSVRMRAPGMFMEMLRRKAQACGGEVIEFNTYTTALSQTCHCGRRKKKPLSQRQHKCECGVTAQRDLYSAFLARHVSKAADGRDTLDAGQAALAWPRAGSALQAAARDFKDATATPLCGAPRKGQSASSGNLAVTPIKATDDVPDKPSGSSREGGGELGSSDQSSHLFGANACWSGLPLFDWGATRSM